MAAPVYIPTNNAQRFQLLPVLANRYCFLFRFVFSFFIIAILIDVSNKKILELVYHCTNLYLKAVV